MIKGSRFLLLILGESMKRSQRQSAGHSGFDCFGLLEGLQIEMQASDK